MLGIEIDRINFEHEVMIVCKKRGKKKKKQPKATPKSKPSLKIFKQKVKYKFRFLR